MSIQTAPEAHERAEEGIGTADIVNEAVEEAGSKNEAKDLAREKTKAKVQKLLEMNDTPEHLIEDVQEDMGWKVAKEAGTAYVKANLEEFK
mgnify:CR=1 FL=1